MVWKQSKYHNKKVIVDGIKFDSKAEATRWQELKLLEKAGEIENLRRQQEYILIPKSKYGRAIKYKADFVYYTHWFENGLMQYDYVVEDVKSKATITPVYKLKKRMMQEKLGITIKETFM